MKNDVLFTNPIGLVTDFTNIFEEISHGDYSSENWFQQYNCFLQTINVQYALDNLTSNPFSERTKSISSSKNSVYLLSNEAFIKKHHDTFLATILRSPINDGEDNPMVDYFNEMLDENKVASLNILNDLFVQNIDNEQICVKILSICNEYNEMDLSPTAQTLAALSISHKSGRVKSAAINLFSHWGTTNAYKLLCNLNCPKEPWIQMKYNRVKQSLKERCCMHEK